MAKLNLLMQSMERNMGKLPESLTLAFNDYDFRGKTTIELSRNCFLDALETALTEKKADPVDRYCTLARLVFSYFNLLYEIEKSSTVKDKLAFQTGQKNIFTSEIHALMVDSSRILLAKTPANLRITKMQFALEKEFLHILSVLKLQTDDRIFEASLRHFARKMALKKHPLMSAYVIETKQRAFGNRVKKFSPLIVALESVVHGLDDYVDDGFENPTDAYLNLVNAALGLFAITLFLFDIQKRRPMENVASLFGKRLITYQLLDSFKESMIDLTLVPFVEKDTQKILKAKTIDEEYEIAIKNLETRTHATTKTFTKPLLILLGEHNSKDANALVELIWISRVMEMFKKDTLVDLESDIRRKDFKASAVWHMKYGKKSGEFMIRIKYLLDLYLQKALDLQKHTSKIFPDASAFIGRKIFSDYLEVRDFVKADHI